MTEPILIHGGSILEYIEERLRRFIGADEETARWRNRLTALMLESAEDAKRVRCVTMTDRIPIDEIYQPTHLTHEITSNQVAVEDIVSAPHDAIIFGGPGYGKTVFLQWCYYQFASDAAITPFFFRLRNPNGAADLGEFVRLLAKHRSERPRETPDNLVLLVDGYDEIPRKERKNVSQSLRRFSALDIGCFLLTCRTHYEVYDLPGKQYRVDPFTREESIRFLASFARHFNANFDPQEVVEELERQSMTSFASHPLLLTLVGLLKTVPPGKIPRQAIGLIERALNVLTDRWDRHRGFNRDTDIPLDGAERMQCLKLVAFRMDGLQGKEVVERAVQEHLSLIQMPEVKSHDLLMEIAQFYGLLVQIHDGWEFTHRTIHDYLAASYWVASGKFVAHRVSEWTMREAYAVCLLPDASTKLRALVEHADDGNLITECLYNQTGFQPKLVAPGVVGRFSEKRKYRYEDFSGRAVVSLEDGEDFFPHASTEFLEHIVERASGSPTEASFAAGCTALSELFIRKSKFPAERLHPGQISTSRARGRDVSVVRNGREISFSLRDVIE